MTNPRSLVAFPVRLTLLKAPMTRSVSEITLDRYTGADRSFVFYSHYRRIDDEIGTVFDAGLFNH